MENVSHERQYKSYFPSLYFFDPIRGEHYQALVHFYEVPRYVAEPIVPV